MILICRPSSPAPDLRGALRGQLGSGLVLDPLPFLRSSERSLFF